LNDGLVEELGAAVSDFQSGGKIGCIILTGNGKAFAAGADIKEMSNKSFQDMTTRDKIAPWEIISQCKVPIIAAVNGVAFGGGCEIAMMCDIILASENAKFGQPEIKIGTIPGAGGTQRLTKAVGKSKAMEMVLTGNPVSAAELEKRGLVSRVVPADKLLPEALALAQQIAGLSLPIVKFAKQSVLSSFDSTLNTGMKIERQLFQSTFALDDQKEGMKAFIEKRKPEWKHQ
jgi:enoyl-CoA hydratase